MKMCCVLSLMFVLLFPAFAETVTNNLDVQGGFIYNHGVINPDDYGLTFTNAGIRDLTVSVGQLSGVDPENGAVITNAANLIPLKAQSVHSATDISAASNVVAGGLFIGDGSGLTNLNLAASETDPVWNEDKANYLTESQSDARYTAQGGVVIGSSFVNTANTVRVNSIALGGVNNVATGSYSTVSGGRNNRTDGMNSSVGGGSGNRASAQGAAVAGGEGNTASGQGSFVGGGSGNTSSGYRSTVTAGENNQGSSAYAAVAGGQNNQASGNGATVGGGKNNRASNISSTVSGGQNNLASGARSVVGGGSSNAASAGASVISGGEDNTTLREYATVGGGRANAATGIYSVVSGGHDGIAGESATVAGGITNRAVGTGSAIGGGQNNLVTAPYAGISGGQNNLAVAGFAHVGGGQNNQAEGSASAVVGGKDNRASGSGAVIAAGTENTASGSSGFIGSGERNTAGGASASVVGGRTNTAAGFSSAVVGGIYNRAENSQSLVGAGRENEAAGDNSAVVGGHGNTASGLNSFIGAGKNNTASGIHSSVPGGEANVASGKYSLAAGYGANATNTGAFVWADSQASAFSSVRDDEFAVRASGGLRLVDGKFIGDGSGLTNLATQMLDERYATTTRVEQIAGSIPGNAVLLNNPTYTQTVAKALVSASIQQLAEEETARIAADTGTVARVTTVEASIGSLQAAVDEKLPLFWTNTLGTMAYAAASNYVSGVQFASGTSNFVNRTEASTLSGDLTLQTNLLVRGQVVVGPAEFEQSVVSNGVSGSLVAAGDVRSFGIYYGDGSGLTNLNAGNITGTISVEQIPAATTNTAGLLTALDKQKLNSMGTNGFIDGSAYLKHDGSRSMTGALNLDGNQIVNMGTATNDANAISRGHVKTMMQQVPEYGDLSMGEFTSQTATPDRPLPTVIHTEDIADGAVTVDKLNEIAGRTVIGNMTNGYAGPVEIEVKDEDDMASNSDMALATQQSIKKYVETSVNDRHLFATNGYQVLPSGLVIQWGSDVSLNQKTVTFPMAFSNACLSVQITRKHPKVWSYGNEAYAHSYSKTSFCFEISGHEGSYQNGYAVSWFAVGY